MKEEGQAFVKALSRLVFGGIILFWCLEHYTLLLSVVQFIFGLIFPFLMGGAIAFLLSIPLRGVEKRLHNMVKKPDQKGLIRGISIVVTLVLIILVVLSVVLIVVPQIGTTIRSIQVEIPEFIQSTALFREKMDTVVPELTKFLDSIGITWENITKTVTELVSSFGGKALNLSISFATSVFGGLVNFFLAFVFAMYLLAGKEWMGGQFFDFLTAYTPPKVQYRTRKIITLTDQIFTAFFTGQCLEACILGGMFFVGMTICGFPYALLISVLVGFTALIPIFGAFIGCIVGAFLILVVNPVQAFWFILFFLALQQIEGNLIYPKVVGGSIGLPPVLVLVAVTIGGSLLGVVGMLLFIPLVSVCYTLLTENMQNRLKAQTPPPSQD